jgi:hypothetical protein
MRPQVFEVKLPGIHFEASVIQFTLELMLQLGLRIRAGDAGNSDEANQTIDESRLIYRFEYSGFDFTQRHANTLGLT